MPAVDSPDYNVEYIKSAVDPADYNVNDIQPAVGQL
jgi:hypothetical protein